MGRVNPATVSKAIDPQTGEPLVVYHGTSGERTVFEPYWKQLERDAMPHELKGSGSIAQMYQLAKKEPEIHFFAAERGTAESYTRANQALQAEVNALMAQAEAIGIDTVLILDDIVKTYANATQDEYNVAAREALAAAISRSNQDSGWSIAAAAPTTQSGGAEKGLTSPTRADIEAQQKARDQAEREQAAANRSADAAEILKDNEPPAANLKKNWPEGQQRTEQAVNSPHPLTAEKAANPEADFPDAQPVADSLTPPAPAAQPDAPKKKPSADKTRAKADLMAALADLGDILGKNTRMNIMPEQEQKLLPVLTRLLDAAFRLGYHKFKDAAKFALDQISANLGDDAADALTLDHLQGAYIAMAGGKPDADTKRTVIDVETKAEIEAHEAVNGTADAAEGGPFGPIFTGHENDPEGAIDKLMREKRGEVPSAYVHPELGPIAFVYGDDKMGLRHIEAKRGKKWVLRIPEILRDGRLERDDELPRVYLIRDGGPADVAVIRLDWDGVQKTWLVTAHPDDQGKWAGADKTSRTVETYGAVQGTPSRADQPQTDVNRNVESDGASAGNADGTYAPNSSGMRNQGGADSQSVPLTTTPAQPNNPDPRAQEVKTPAKIEDFGQKLEGGRRPRQRAKRS